MMPVKEIALAFPRGMHQEMFIDGMLQYAHEHNCNWSYVTAPESLSLSILDLRGWRGDGVITALNTPAEAVVASALATPTINISSTLAQSPVPRVNVDNRLIGELAADCLLERGFQCFAYYGLRHVAYSQLRQEGFASRLASAGRRCSVLLSAATFALRGKGWREQHRALAEWLSGLPRPVALFAITDYRARQVLDVCRHIGLQVPQQIAVLGVDNEEVICQHVHPQLSSVARNNHLEGYRTAAMLDGLVQGKTMPKDELIPPLGVVERESTDVVAVSDARVREAIDYVRRHLQDPFEVNKLAAHVGVSRRWLEYAFRDAVGKSPYQFARRQRLEFARRLLVRESTAKIYEIAAKTGFSTAKQLTMAFRQEFGQSPRDYRRSSQENSPPTMAASSATTPRTKY